MTSMLRPPMVLGRHLAKLEQSIWNDKTAFVARTLLGMAIALYAALFLQLSSPGSAAVTVAIVANTSRGGVLSKGLWRIFGTLTGAVATIILFAWFAQAPILFLVALGLWLAACVFVAGILRHFRSYSAVLAGYTVAIITAGALTDPANVLQYALSRLAVVSIGVISAGLVSMISQPGPTFNGVLEDFQSVLVTIAKGLQQRDGQNETPMDIPGTTGLLNKLDAGIEFSGMEAPHISRRAGALRRGVAALYSAYLSVPVVRDALRSVEEIETSRSVPERGELESWVAEVDAALCAASEREVADVRGLTDIAADLQSAATKGAAVLRNAANRAHLADVVRVQRELEILSVATMHFADAADRGTMSDPTRPLYPFKDYQDASRNASRTAVATILAGLLCYFTAWTQSGACIGTVASLCALMAAAPSASAASVEFTKGAILSSVAAYICEFILLPHVSGFPLFFLAMAPFLAVGCYTMTIPRLNGRSFGFIVLFITQMTIANTMRYNALSFFNGAEAYALSGIIIILVFRVLLPVDPASEVRRFVTSIRVIAERYLRNAAGAHTPGDWLGWVVTLNQSVHLALGRLRQAEPDLVPQLVNDSGALVLMTFEIDRIRNLIRAKALAEPDVRLIERALATLSGHDASMQADRALDIAVNELLLNRAAELDEEGGRLAAASGLQSILLLLPAVERLMSLSRSQLA